LFGPPLAGLPIFKLVLSNLIIVIYQRNGDVSLRVALAIRPQVHGW